MPVIFQQSHNEIRFTIWGTICRHISKWEYSVDEMVFNEQLATGSFRGRYQIDDETRALMEYVKAQGQIAPYYGVGGSQGSCVYTLQFSDDGYKIQVENTTAQESTEFTDQVNATPHEQLPARLQTWLATRLNIGEVARPYFVLRVNGKELQTLRSWTHWNESRAATSRYLYSFGRVSMGRLGFTVQVTDKQSNEQIDVTDYADW